MNPLSPNKWIGRVSILLSVATLFLIFVGGLVTSTDSGLAVPDWPLSYGRIMPPMIGGIFYEHGHRMVAAMVGFLTVFFAFFVTLKESRPFVKLAAWIAVAMVILQGLLGGVTVLFLLPRPVSILHACLAQTFLCLVVALSVWTSRTWQEPKTIPPLISAHAVSLRHLASTVFLVSYVQLILGAVLRHTGWGVTAHIGGAILVTFLSTWLFLVCKSIKPRITLLSAGSFLLMCLVYTQMGLGLFSYILLGHNFHIIPIPFFAVLIITLHVVTGAAILALSVILVLNILRLNSTSSSAAPLTKLSDYFELTKPGITFTAGITALAGFVLGSPENLDLIKLWHTGVGTLLVAAGAGTLNMLIEKETDAKMKRTQKRPLPAGRLKSGEVLFLGTLLSSAALIYLSWTVNLLTATIAGLTLSVYLYIYTPLKKITSLCTTVGAVAGALPPVMGWAAAAGRLGWEVAVLFSILFFWQFPHFFSLAWLYKDDYSKAGLHMLPRIHDNGQITALSIILNCIALFLVSLLPTWIGLTGLLYSVSAFVLGIWLLSASAQFYFSRSSVHARKIFFASLFYIPLLVLSMIFNKSTHF